MGQESPLVKTQLSGTFGYADFMTKVLDPVITKSHALGDNLSRLVGLEGQPFRSTAELGRHLRLSVGEAKTLTRLVKQPGYRYAYSSLQAIADGFRIDPWMLLIPGFNPTDPTHRQFWGATFELWQHKPHAPGH